LCLGIVGPPWSDGRPSALGDRRAERSVVIKPLPERGLTRATTRALDLAAAGPLLYHQTADHSVTQALVTGGVLVALRISRKNPFRRETRFFLEYKVQVASNDSRCGKLARVGVGLSRARALLVPNSEPQGFDHRRGVR